MKTLLTALAAVILSSLFWSQPAEARCWWNGYRWHCSHHRHHYWHARYYPYYYGYRPYYRAAYYRPYYRPYAYYRPYYCIPFTPFCG